MPRHLFLARHGESEWNALNLFTGQRDPGLTENGIAEAHSAGQLLARRGIIPDETHTSVLRRAMDTASIMLEEMNCVDVPVHRSALLNERDYGDLTGMNKDEARKRWGNEQVHLWRRSYNIAPPGGESLRDTLERVRGYYEEKILPSVLQQRTLLVVAHGNSLRSLMAFLENLDEESVQTAQIETGEILFYELDEAGGMANKERLSGDSPPS